MTLMIFIKNRQGERNGTGNTDTTHHTNEEHDIREILRLECLHGEGHMYATDVDQEESA